MAFSATYSYYAVNCRRGVKTVIPLSRTAWQLHLPYRKSVRFTRAHLALWLVVQRLGNILFLSTCQRSFWIEQWFLLQQMLVTVVDQMGNENQAGKEMLFQEWPRRKEDDKSFITPTIYLQYFIHEKYMMRIFDWISLQMSAWSFDVTEKVITDMNTLQRMSKSRRGGLHRLTRLCFVGTVVAMLLVSTL